MKVSFPYYVDFGPGSHENCEVVVELTEAENERLVKSAHEEPRWDLWEDNAIDDIYKKVLDAAIHQELEVVKSDKESMLEMMNEYLDEEDKREDWSDEEIIGQMLEIATIDACYPQELKNLEK